MVRGRLKDRDEATTMVGERLREGRWAVTREALAVRCLPVPEADSDGDGSPDGDEEGRVAAVKELLRVQQNEL